MQEHKFFPFAFCNIDLTFGDAEGGAVAMNYLNRLYIYIYIFLTTMDLINEVYILQIINNFCCLEQDAEKF